MSTPKTQPRLSFRLKLILGYLYFIASLTAFVAVTFSFESAMDTEVEPAVRIATVVTSIVSSALYVWVTYLMHTRRQQTAIAFVVASLVSYGLTDLAGQSDMSVSTIILSLTFLAIELTIALFLLQSKEAKSLLSNK